MDCVDEVKAEQIYNARTSHCSIHERFCSINGQARSSDRRCIVCVCQVAPTAAVLEWREVEKVVLQEVAWLLRSAALSQVAWTGCDDFSDCSEPARHERTVGQHAETDADVDLLLL